MIFVEQAAILEAFTSDAALLIERAGRTCYKSEGRAEPGSAAAFIRMLRKRGHLSVLEHASATIRFVTDRGITHELVRHRLAAYSQESTRYVSSTSEAGDPAETDQDVIELYAAGLSMRRIAEMSKGRFTEWEVYKALDEADVARRSRGNTGVVVSDYFDQIDTAEKAYLLGVIQADGSIRKDDSPQVAITQHQDHAWYLHRMVTEFIRPAARASVDKQCRQITFTSQGLWNALVGMGVVPNKSYDQTDEDILKLWTAIPSELIPSFLRGFLDGDGGVRFFTQSNPGRTDSCNVHWSGHPALLLRIADWLENVCAYRARPLPVAGTAHLHRLAVTTPSAGEEVVRQMLGGFRWPYGHPTKTARMIDRVGGRYPTADFGDRAFQVIHPDRTMPASATFAWLKAMDASERSYAEMRRLGVSPQFARSVLPNSLKTEIVMTANFREWLHVIDLRTSTAAHPQIRHLIGLANDLLITACPEVFGEMLDD